MTKINPNIVRVCKRCGKEYHPTSSRQQCCNSPVKIPCEVCGTLMDRLCTFARQNTTCSAKCASELGNRSRSSGASKLTKICKYCGKEFHPKSARDVYCNNKHYATCQICGKEFEIVGRIDLANKTCSEGCRYISAKKNTDMEHMVETMRTTLQEKYGVDNAMQLPEVKDKVKATTREHYGVKYYTQTPEYKARAKATNLEKYGVEYPIASPEIIAKREQTNLERYGATNIFASEYGKAQVKAGMLEQYGVENPGQSPEIQQQIKRNNMEKYGVEHPMMLSEYKEKAIKTNMRKFGYKAPTQAHIKNIANWYEFINNPREYINNHYTNQFPRTAELAQDLGVHPSTIDDYLNKYHAEDCIRRSHSLMEDEVTDFILSVKPGCKIIRNTRHLLDDNRSELDIYLPEYNFAIECNPTVTHNSSVGSPWGNAAKPISYHKHKTDKSEIAGIFLMHLFGYEWTHNKPIMQSMIANILGCNAKIYARKCEVAEISTDDARKFLAENHRQGFTGSKIYLGLKYEDELVSVMSFGKFRSTIGTDTSDLSNCWELARFCNKLNTSVVGGASKLFNHFIAAYHPTKIRSFSDRAHTKGNLYATLGFMEIRRSDPNYVWINVINDRAYHRVSAQKRNLKKFLKDDTIDLSKSERVIMEEHGYVKMYDSGTITWEWNSQH